MAPLSPKDWLDIAKDVALALIGPTVGYLGARKRATKHQEEKERRWDRAAELSALNQTAVQTHDATLAEHTLLHKMYAANFAGLAADVRSIRDCTNRIAGHLGIDGTS